MKYPNTISSRQAAAGLSGQQTAAVPRPKPGGQVIPFPGKTKPKGPRRVPRQRDPSRRERIRKGLDKAKPQRAPRVRPTPARPTPLVPVTPPAPVQVAKPNWASRVNPYLEAFNIGFEVGTWLFGDGAVLPAKPEMWTGVGVGRYHLWSLDPDGYQPPPGWVSMGFAKVSGYVPSGDWSGRPYSYQIGMQSGYHPNVPTDGEGNFLITLDGTNGNMFVEVFAPGGDASQERGWFNRSYRRGTNLDGVAQVAHAPAQPAKNMFPNVNYGYGYGIVPWAMPVAPPHIPLISPPAVKPGFAAQPGADPKPPPTLPRPAKRPRVVHKPYRPGTKEKKTRMPYAIGLLWNLIGGVTEVLDFVDVLYESLDWRIKRAIYEALGRQPNPIEKAAAIYRFIDSLNVPAAIEGYITQQIGDMISSLGGEQLAQANNFLDRPIGFEAGPGIGGGVRGQPRHYHQVKSWKGISNGLCIPACAAPLCSSRVCFSVWLPNKSRLSTCCPRTWSSLFELWRPHCPDSD